MMTHIKTYYKVTIIKTGYYLAKDEHLYQWKYIKSPETDRHIYHPLIYDI